MGASAPDKLFALLDGQPVLLRALRAFADAPSIRTIIVATRSDCLERVAALTAGCEKCVRLCVGGERRRDSVAAGLDALPADTEIVTVHDAARPLVDPHLIDEGVRLARQHGAAAPALPVSDTIKRVVDGHAVASPPRSELWAAQTPQTFQVALLRRAHAATGDDATDDSTLVERLGHPVRIYPGSRRNLKITTVEDLVLCEALLRTP
jgi:2-C-methyl-D-erythritol 4-phosphate cytidylyltransferase